MNLHNDKVNYPVQQEMDTIVCEFCDFEFSLIIIIRDVDDDNRPTVQIWDHIARTEFCPQCGKRIWDIKEK